MKDLIIDQIYRYKELFNEYSHRLNLMSDDNIYRGLFIHKVKFYQREIKRLEKKL